MRLTNSVAGLVILVLLTGLGFGLFSLLVSERRQAAAREVALALRAARLAEASAAAEAARRARMSAERGGVPEAPPAPGDDRDRLVLENEALRARVLELESRLRLIDPPSAPASPAVSPGR